MSVWDKCHECEVSSFKIDRFHCYDFTTVGFLKHVTIIPKYFHLPLASILIQKASILPLWCASHWSSMVVSTHPSVSLDTEDVRHAYRYAWNSVSRMVSINIARSAWRWLSKCVFVLVLSWELEPVGASYSVHR